MGTSGNSKGPGLCGSLIKAEDLCWAQLFKVVEEVIEAKAESGAGATMEVSYSFEPMNLSVQF